MLGDTNKIFKESAPTLDAVPAKPKTEEKKVDPILPVIGKAAIKRTETIEIPLPEEDPRFEEYSTDELFGALLRRIKKEKARIMLQAGYAQFQEIARRTTPAYAVDQALHILREIASGQVRTAYILEHEQDDPMDHLPK